MRSALAGLLVALLAACQTTPTNNAPGNVSHLPPGNASRDGPEASPPPNLDAVPDAVPQIEPLRVGGPNKPYEVGGRTYVPLTDDRAVTEKGLASWYGKKFHGHRTASGEAYNMYAMTAAHKTWPIPSYARVRNPANGREVIVRVNDRGPFSPGRVIDLSYTAALKLGVLGGVQPVEISRITDDDIRTGTAFKHAPTYATAPAAAQGAATGTSTTAPGVDAAVTTIAVGDLDRPTTVRGRPRLGNAASTPDSGTGTGNGNGNVDAAQASASLASTDASAAPAKAASASPTASIRPIGEATDGLAAAARGTSTPADLGSAAATDVAAPANAPTTTVTTEMITRPATRQRPLVATPPSASTPLPMPAGVTLPPAAPVAQAAGAQVVVAAATGASVGASPGASPPQNGPVAAPARAEPRDEHAHAETTAGAGYWLQLGAYKQRDGALDFQRRLIDEQPWLAPLLAVFSDHGLNKLQAGPYTSRDDAKSAADRIRVALQLVPTIVEKR